MPIKIQVRDEDNQERPREMSVPGTEPLWTVIEVANYLRLGPETVRVMARRGELPSMKVGRRVWRFKPSDVKNWLNLHQPN